MRTRLEHSNAVVGDGMEVDAKAVMVLADEVVIAIEVAVLTVVVVVVVSDPVVSLILLFWLL